MAENPNTNEKIYESLSVSDNVDTDVAERSLESALGDKTEQDSKVSKEPENSLSFLARLVITLTAICVAIAVLLAAVNAVTRDKIAENTLKAKTEAVLSIFKAGTDCELYKTLDDGTEVYLVYREGDIIGYCNFVSSVGFGGNIDMMVGINADYKTEGVSIVSMSETPGVGTKTNTPDFLSRFTGTSHDAPVAGVDAVSGATISSNAVKAGVTAAHKVEIDLTAVAGEKGCRLLTPDQIAQLPSGDTTSDEAVSPDTSTETADPAPNTEKDPVSQDTTSTETDPTEDTTDLPFIDNPGGIDYIYNVGVASGEDRYVIEIPKDDETATSEKTTEPVKTSPPVTTSPATRPSSTTAKPVTEPSTEPVATEAATTKEPVTEAPVTEADTTEAATTEPPVTEDSDVMPPLPDTQPEETMPSQLD